MSDEEEGDVEVEEGDGENDDGDEETGDSGPLDPCCSCSLGLALLLVAVCGLWWNEGKYVSTMENLNTVSKTLLLPCRSACSSCDFENAQEFTGGKRRSIKDGDTVYMGCDLQGLEDVSTALSGQLKTPELLGALTEKDEAKKAAAWEWSTEMYQYVLADKSVNVPDLKKFQNGRFENSKKFCLWKQTQVCDKKQQRSKWNKVDDSTPKPEPGPSPKPEPSPTPNPEPAPTPTNDCSGLNKATCAKKAEVCVWDWFKCDKVLEEADCRKLDSKLCRWTNAPIKDCKGGCCKTDDTWRFACKLKAQPAPEPVPSPSPSTSGCSNLTQGECKAKTEDCVWDFFNCEKKNLPKEECQKLDPDLCKWGNSTEEAQERCRKTGNTWRFACKAKPKTESATVLERSLRSGEMSPQSGEMSLQYGEMSLHYGDMSLDDESHIQDQTSPRFPRSPRLRTPELAKSDRCKFQECNLVGEWNTKLQQSPDVWDKLPWKKGSSDLEYARPPAYNMKELGEGNHQIHSKVRLGPQGSSEGQSLSISDLASEVFPKSSFEGVDLKQLEPKEALSSKTSTTVLAHGEAKVRIISHDRSGPNSTWTVENSEVGLRCKDGCICSSSGTSGAAGGDLRLCIKASTTQRLSIIGKVRKDKDTWKVAESVTMKLNELVGAEDLITQERSHADTLLKVLRFIFPLVMWLGFYCCLSPIIWVLDMLQSAVGSIPCVGDFMERIVGCVETLAECAICMVSCATALSCSLFIGALAWVRFRPQIGVPLLIVALVFFAGLAYFTYSRQGAQKVRRGSRAARASRRSSASAREVPASAGVELQPAQASQFPVLCPEGVEPGGLVQVTAPDGRLLQVTVPEGISPGEQFMVSA